MSFEIILRPSTDKMRDFKIYFVDVDETFPLAVKTLSKYQNFHCTMSVTSVIDWFLKGEKFHAHLHIWQSHSFYLSLIDIFNSFDSFHFNAFRRVASSRFKHW